MDDCHLLKDLRNKRKIYAVGYRLFYEGLKYLRYIVGATENDLLVFTISNDATYLERLIIKKNMLYKE